ncbi:Major fimbrial subunit SMF-1 [Paraburkholderia nemoris]|uniref:fimbrial protein n=1 Tax=Paraburkholderia nemoris TaxID=2793076 RepID=UPI001909C955|nr:MULTISPECIES: fimbrial protein [Paraburkholderia]MBK3786922.1 type 1 fimbrial protein [Paraburkholderia aspalathi]CAE6859132.1 Major fimbrial subunit SMF-1 [Paraburkholderia nemoris]
MKKNLLLFLLAVTSLAALAPAAHAYDGTINFTGNFVAPTCTINSGSPNLTVTLPTAFTTSLVSAGQTTGKISFSIKLTQCSGSTATAYLSGSTVDTATGHLIVSGGATNVEIGLLNNESQPIVASAAAGSQNVDVVNISSGSATLSFYAQYVATGKVTAGAANSSVLYTMIYQ